MTKTTRWLGAALCGTAVLTLPNIALVAPAGAAAPSNSSGFLTSVGGAGFDTIKAVAVANDQTIYLTGTTDGSLSTVPGDANKGGTDIFVSRVDRSGNRIWTRQFGTGGNDEATGIAVSRFGEIYVVGSVRGLLQGADSGAADAVLASFSGGGRLRWRQQFGSTADDTPTGVGVSSQGDVYLTGWTDGSLAGASNGGRDAFVRRVSRKGTVHWTRQYGTDSDDDAAGLVIAAPLAVYVTGSTEGLMGLAGEGNPGTTDGYVMRIDRHGASVWTHQFGGAGEDGPTAIARSSSGSLLVLGSTTGSLDGPNRGETDLFVAGLSRSGIRQWFRQFGTPDIDRPTGMVLTRASELYVGGTTFGSMNQPNLGGGGDAFVSKLSLRGQRQWTEQFGTVDMDEVLALGASPSGDVFAAGYTYGDLNGTTNGGVEGFLLRLDTRESRTWTHQLASTGTARSSSVAPSTRGDVYVAGTATGTITGTSPGGEDAFVAKYTASGTLAWLRQFGTAGDDRALATATTRGGDVVVVGSTTGTLAGAALGDGDAFVARYSRTGRLLWARQFGTALADGATTVTVSRTGDILVAGTTMGTMSTFAGEANAAGSQDVFLTKFGPTGTRTWTRQFGSEDLDVANASAIAPNGDILLAGTTFGSLSTVPGEVSLDAFDGFVARFDRNGTPKWRRQFGSESNDIVTAITTNPTGGFNVAGLTGGTINEPHQGGTEAFVAHFEHSGERVWLHPFGTIFNDSAAGATALANGDIVVTGTTEGQLGAYLAGGSDFFVARYTNTGAQTSLKQFGTAADEEAYGVARGIAGSLFVVGRTAGSMNEDSGGGDDGFVSRIT